MDRSAGIEMINFHFNDYPELIEFHQQTKINFTIQDAYKLIYQSIFGSTHLLRHPEQARVHLIEEYEALSPSSEEPLIEPISPRKDIVRINLRPFKVLRQSIDLLFQAMLTSAQQLTGSLSEMQCAWDELKRAIASNRLHFDQQELEIFNQEIHSKNFPAIHHSALYRMANHPAYRVVRLKEFEKYFA